MSDILITTNSEGEYEVYFDAAEHDTSKLSTLLRRIADDIDNYEVEESTYIEHKAPTMVQ